jgi:hypothetical protein
MATRLKPMSLSQSGKYGLKNPMCPKYVATRADKAGSWREAGIAQMGR